MKSIADLSAEEYKEYYAIYKDLYAKTSGLSKQAMFDNYKRTVGYAHYKFSGDISDRLIEALGGPPTPVQIIMLVDGGFSHFGASCHILGRHFEGRVNVD